MKIKLFEAYDIGHKTLPAGAVVEFEDSLAEQLIQAKTARKAFANEEAFMRQASQAKHKKQLDESKTTEAENDQPETVQSGGSGGRGAGAGRKLDK